MTERPKENLFHKVGAALSDRQRLVVASTDTARSALQLMQQHRIAQLPIVEHDRLIGMFSYRSFAQRVLALADEIDKLLELPVEEYIEKATPVSVDDDLVEQFEALALRDAVVVGSKDLVQGVVTTTDALHYFHDAASAFVMLGEIEGSLRDLVQRSIGNDELQQLIAQTLAEHYPPERLPAEIIDLTLHDCIRIVQRKDSWSRFKRAFGGNRQTFTVRMRAIPDLRNAVFHFRREITSAEREQLRNCREYLAGRLEIANVRRKEGSNG